MYQIYSEVKWALNITTDLSVSHQLTIKLFQLDAAVASVHEELSLGLPRTGSFSNFVTTIDGTDLGLGYGFIPDRSIYALKVNDIANLTKNTPAIITISFQEKGCVRKLRGLCIYEINFIPHLLQSASELTIKVPISSDHWRRFIVWLLSKLGRAEAIPGICVIGCESDNEPTVDSRQFSFRDGFPIFAVAFSPRIPIDKASLLGGIFIGVFASIIGGLILWVL